MHLLTESVQKWSRRSQNHWNVLSTKTRSRLWYLRVHKNIVRHKSAVQRFRLEQTAEKSKPISLLCPTWSSHIANLQEKGREAKCSEGALKIRNHGLVFASVLLGALSNKGLEFLCKPISKLVPTMEIKSGGNLITERMARLSRLLEHKGPIAKDPTTQNDRGFNLAQLSFVARGWMGKSGVEAIS